MCLILIAFQHHPEYPLVVAANRDEFFERPTQAAHFWQDQPDLLAGRDLSAGGTWLGITRQGRFAALTNVRDGQRPEQPGAASRGGLVTDFLNSPLLEAADYLQRLEGDRYNGFNLICGDPSRLLYASNRQDGITTLLPGVHGVSNGVLDSPWPKLIEGKQALTNQLDQRVELTTDDLLPLLNHRERAPDHRLPDTGVPLDWERTLSSRFIEGQAYHYGTRASTVLLLHRDGSLQFSEWSWDEQGQVAGRRDFDLTLPKPDRFQ